MMDEEGFRRENAELKIRLRELEETLQAIHSGDVDALIVSNDIFVLESARGATHQLREDVLGQMQDAVLAFDTDDHVIYVNHAAECQYGVSSSDVLGRPRADVFVEVADAAPALADLPHADGLPPRRNLLHTHRLPDGRTVHAEVSVSPLVDTRGRVIGSLWVVRDVTQRHRAEVRRDGLARLTNRLRDLQDVHAVGVHAAQTLGEILIASHAGYGTIDPATETLFVGTGWNVPGTPALSGEFPLRDYGDFIDDLKRNELVHVADVRTDARTRRAADRLEARGARAFVSVPLVEDGRLVALLYVHDRRVHGWRPDDLEFIREVAERARTFSDRIRSATALRESELRLRQLNEGLEATVLTRTHALMVAEESLRQAQKMESVGQLTGGIAHDFNNLLAAMSTSLQLLKRRLSRGDFEGHERYLSMAQESIKRAASLTQRLLAFARRQTLDPKPTDLNRLIAGLEELIRRTVGPDVELEVSAAGGLWTTRIDPSQLENSVLNLCINARDAMLPGGGRLTIRTANASFDDHAAAERDLAPGQYVTLCVTDTGTGMSPDVAKRIFDPFFTTKPLGQGTGLGLSMVYGFVRQSGGQVRVYSEAGRGTTMCLYLPRHVGEAQPDDLKVRSDALEAGDGECVLLIEDETTIRVLIAEVLKEAGYQVVTAEDGPSGLRLLQSPGRLDLLITDVGLPGGLNGRQVADAGRTTRPDLKVLFITGFAENAAVGNGLLDPGMEVLTKPFEIAVLTKKVRTMIAQTP